MLVLTLPPPRPCTISMHGNEHITDVQMASRSVRTIAAICHEWFFLPPFLHQCITDAEKENGDEKKNQCSKARFQGKFSDEGWIKILHKELSFYNTSGKLEPKSKIHVLNFIFVMTRSQAVILKTCFFKCAPRPISQTQTDAWLGALIPHFWLTSQRSKVETEQEQDSIRGSK